MNFDTHHFTKAERIVGRILQEERIPFSAKVKVEGHEADFLIGNVIIEVDGHAQNPEKNNEFVRKGYVPVHFSNWEVRNSREIVKKTILWHLQDSAFRTEL